MTKRLAGTLFAIFLTPALSLAQSYQFAPAGTNGTATTSSAATTSNSTTGTINASGYQFAPAVPAPAPTPAPTPAPQGINPAANQGQQSQQGGAGANAAAGAALMAAGMALMSNPTTMPMGAALTAMGVLAMMQSGADQNAADQSGATAAASQNSGSTGSNLTNNNAAGAGTAGFAANPQVAAAQAALAQNGYAVTPTTLTTPSGSYPTSSLGSAGGLAAAGLDPGALKEAQKIAGGATGTNANVAGLGVQEGSTGAANSGAKAFTIAPFSLPIKNASGLTKNQMVAGKTVNFDGEPIGVRGDDIFEMVHTAYNKRSERGNFIQVDSAPSLRAPASAPTSAPR